MTTDTKPKLAYEEILMAFENGDLNKIKKLSSKDVFTAFKEVIDDRNQKGLHVEATFGGVRDIRIRDVKFNKKSLEANITICLLYTSPSPRDRG